MAKSVYGGEDRGKSGERRVVVIGGPTASGKSALALAVARQWNGVVINADSMQIYQGLPLLTAQPGAGERALAPHRLYGALPPGDVCSAGRWRGLALAEIEAAWAGRRLPVVVGGTGLYLRALLDGLSPIPEVPEPVRAEARARLAELGNQDFHARLAERDPVMAARLHPGNSQRLVRAWEVLAATGRSLAAWQDLPPTGGLAAEALMLVLVPPRAQLYESCDRRLAAMVAGGALDEVRALAELRLGPALPAMKALGVPELMAALDGRLALDDAVAAAQLSTRRFAKRQLTWFRHQATGAHRIDAQFSESPDHEIFPIIRQFLLTGAGARSRV